MAVDDVLAQVEDGVRHLLGTTPVPEARALLIVAALAVLATLWGPVWRAGRVFLTIAHEGGHAAAAVLTRRSVARVRINPDTSGLTQTYGRPHGPGAALVSFAGYPFPAMLGAGLVAAAVSGYGRLWTAVAGLALVVLLWWTRNLYGWLAVSACVVGTALLAWYAPGQILVLALVGIGMFLLAGSLRDLLAERRARRAGHRNSDVFSLGARSRLPAGAWWLAMTGVVALSGWLTWEQLSGLYRLS